MTSRSCCNNFSKAGRSLTTTLLNRSTTLVIDAIKRWNDALRDTNSPSRSRPWKTRWPRFACWRCSVAVTVDALLSSSPICVRRVETIPDRSFRFRMASGSASGSPSSCLARMSIDWASFVASTCS
ncbi:Uncharacterised protein [Mycobacteroides abscessus subsp. abscessus]|nr:Uncharacterised protein [Mycobacteroides abscessus subsp. abscessus]